MLEGAMRPDEIARACVRHALPAAAITDRDVMFGVMEAADALSSQGVQPIIGCLLSVARLHGPGFDVLTLLAQSQQGYGNLSRLVSRAHLGVEPHQPPHVTLDALEGLTDGLLCLTGGGEGALARLLAQGQSEAAQTYLERLRSAFPERLYIELTRTGTPVEVASDAALIDLAYTQGLPLVATNPVQYLSPDFLAAHDAMLCIASSRYVEEADRPRTNPEYWFKSPEDMAALFADVPEAIANTLVIAQRSAVSPPKRKPILPRYSADGDEAGALAQMAQEGLA
ncbi:MAG: DNA polymerase III subunit alpha, partial [Rhodocyclaceae bacterium]|nr:DNA polymerase III subunit alpha [Rhodocyclaceae bacterium]